MTYIQAHKLTFLEMINSDTPVINHKGIMIGGPNRKAYDDKVKWSAWQKAVQHACREVGAVPPNVMSYFQDTKHLSSPPKKGDVNIMQNGPIEDALILKEVRICAALPPDTAPYTEGGVFEMPKNKLVSKPPRFTWSYSQLSSFLNCPCAWAAQKYYKTAPYVESEAMRIGNVVHKALENAVIGKASASELKLIKDWNADKYVRVLEQMRSQGAQVYAEKELCFDNKLRFSSWWANDTVWFRGKADIIVIKDNKLTVWDYKTGKVTDDQLQLRMMCAFAALYYPEVDIFDGKLLFLRHDQIGGLKEPLKRSDMKPILAEVISIVRRMEAAWESECFPAKKSGLCRPNGKGYAGCQNKACPHAE